MRKIIVTILMVAMLFSIAMVPAYADCMHDSISLVDSTPRGRYVKRIASDTQHLYGYYYLHRCNICGQEFTLPTDTGYEAHTFTYYDDYHGTGSNHFYQYKCTQCGFIKTVRYNCPGNPCIPMP